MMTPKKLVVVAPHPDDETLGCGGSIARFAGLGTEVSVLVVSGHLPPLYDRDVFEISRKEPPAPKSDTVREVEFGRLKRLGFVDRAEGQFWTAVKGIESHLLAACSTVAMWSRRRAGPRPCR